MVNSLNNNFLKREDLEKIESENLAGYAVKSKDADHLYDIKECEYRTSFQRDRDRIIHSRAFKRLMDKTQVYMTLKGDHFRNRLSHTLEVAQISKSIATALNLNVDLVEAIALGHDLGHTPFGHAVEDVLDIKLKNEGGFKHNYQSLLVVDYLETRFNDGKSNNGLNLTNYTRYGILNHTKIFENKKFYNKKDKDYLLITSQYKSIEAELVKIVDTLAYLNHDLDDAINCTNIFTSMRRNDKNQYEEFKLELDKIYKNAAILINQEELNSVGECLEFFTSNILLKAMIKDLREGTYDSIQVNKIESLEDVKKQKNAIVKFKSFEKDFENLKDLLKTYVYSSPIANQMDTKAKFIINRLYDSFWENPNQLHYSTRKMFDKSKNNNYGCERMDFGYKITPNRVICNYLSGMTDRYALENYKTMFE